MLMRIEALLKWAQDVPRPNAISILTSCTGLKAEGPRRAEEMYLGQQHVRLMAGIERHRSVGAGPLRLSILSAKYGVIDGAKVIEPYDFAFHGMCTKRFDEHVEQLGIPEACADFLRDEAYDLKIIALGLKYLEACRFRFEDIHGTTVFFCSSGHAAEMKDDKRRPELVVVPLSDRDARNYRCGAVGLKGELTSRLLDALREPVPVSWPEPGGRGDIRADL